MESKFRAAVTALGAEYIGQVPEVGGGAFGAAQLAHILEERLKPSQDKRPGRPRLADDLEELAFSVSLNVEGDNAGRSVMAGGLVSNLERSADAGKLDVEEVGVHDEENTRREIRIRNHSTE